MCFGYVKSYVFYRENFHTTAIPEMTLQMASLDVKSWLASKGLEFDFCLPF